jgi:hypothetical protein
LPAMGVRVPSLLMRCRRLCAAHDLLESAGES